MSSIQEEGHAIPDVCRVCTVSHVDMVNIFNCINGNLADDIHFCTGIVILENNNLPNKICNGCIRQLCVAYKFKLNCLLAEKTLRELRNVVNIEIKCESIEEEATDEATEMCDSQTEESGSDSLSDVREEPKERVTRRVNDTCWKCGAKFPAVKELLAHKRKCKKDTKEECICMRLSSKVGMYQHNLSHLPPKYFCAHCEYKSTNKQDLVKHIKLHTGEKNYQCKYCGRLFTVSSNLVSHVRWMHESTEETKLPCPLCHKRYKDKQALNKHIRTHSGTNEREYRCDVCGAGFNRRSHWKKHLETKHNIVVPILKQGRRRKFNNEERIKNMEGPNGVPLLGIDLPPHSGTKMVLP